MFFVFVIQTSVEDLPGLEN